jgi:hypothetical protein
VSVQSIRILNLPYVGRGTGPSCSDPIGVWTILNTARLVRLSHANWRGSAIGIYRFWRDLGYGIGALGLGIAAHFSGSVESAFWFVAIVQAPC